MKNLRWRTNAILEIANPQYFRNHLIDLDEVLHKHAECGCKSHEKLKFVYFTNSRWRTAAILEIEYSQYQRKCSSDEHADSGRKQYERLKFAHLKSLRRRTAAIVGIENLQ